MPLCILASGPDNQRLVTGMPGPMLVGDFTHEDGSRYIMVVNKDFVMSAICALTYRQAAQVQLVSPYSGQLIPFDGEQVWLAPGQAHLLKITP